MNIIRYSSPNGRSSLRQSNEFIAVRWICKKQKGLLYLASPHHFHLSLSLLGATVRLTCIQWECRQEVIFPWSLGAFAASTDFQSHRWFALTWAGGGTAVVPQLLRMHWSLEARVGVSSACGCPPQGLPLEVCCVSLEISEWGGAGIYNYFFWSAEPYVLWVIIKL